MTSKVNPSGCWNARPTTAVDGPGAPPPAPKRVTNIRLTGGEMPGMKVGKDAQGMVSIQGTCTGVRPGPVPFNLVGLDVQVGPHPRDVKHLSAAVMDNDTPFTVAKKLADSAERQGVRLEIHQPARRGPAPAPDKDFALVEIMA